MQADVLDRTVENELDQRVGELSSQVGNTPLFPITRVFNKPNVKLFAKLEWQQMGSSVKARPAYRIIREAVAAGQLNEGKSLLDATSGNTGIAYATFGAALGIPVTLCVPENISSERKRLLLALGAKLIYTSAFDNTDGAQIEAKRLFAENPHKYYYADQYANAENWKAHFFGTSNEVINQTNAEVTHFVAGLGTSGTFTGTGRGLKNLNPDIHLTSLQPDGILHGLEGWKHMESAIVPKFYDSTLADQNLEIDTQEALNLIPEVARKEGLLISPSSAANLLGAMKVAEQVDEGVIVTVFPDNADKYKEIIDELF